ncbi:MAG: M36 family metallopeptidase, partial [Rubricoccaceae bacterium]|nr:M36 family metallopeptidase [Rubricoccaceae bacterium]
YGDTATGGLSVPHGIGFVWATIVWEMTWDLIAAHGYDPDIYNAAGTAGNQIALQLVTEGLKLQPCSPGFVDGRDAILEADQMLYGGANTQILWEAFARRGLGLNADQGSSNSNADNMEDFTVPVSNQVGTDLPESYSLSRAYPNPFNPQAQFTLEVNTAQDVRIEIIDALGRMVGLLHDGQLASGVAHQFTIDGTNLASGIYTYRVIGETFSSSRRVTLLK